jgi:integrase
MSLGEYGYRRAVLRASPLALHSQSFFTAIRSSMKHLTPDQIAQLVTAWRDRMRERDAEIRRKIEVGLHPKSLQDYADHCEASSDVFESLLEQLVSAPASLNDEDERPQPTQRERDEAYRSAADAMTIDEDPDCDLVPVIDSAMLAGLDKLSQRDLAKNYLMTAGRIYWERVGDSLSLTPATELPPVSAPSERTTVAPAASDKQVTVSETWNSYLRDRARSSIAWRNGPPEKARLAFQDFSQLTGDKPITEVTRADCNRFLAFQEKRPNGNVRSYRGVHATKLESETIPAEHRQSSQNATHKVVEITRFFAWCETEHLIPKSPAASLKVAPGDSFEVEPWTDDEIKVLLDPTNLRKHSGLSDKRSKVHYIPWTAVLGVYTGARIAEIVGVRITDFLRHDGVSEGTVPVMIVDEYDDKSIKTENARRKIPLHPDLEALGLWEYIASRVHQGKAMLVDCPTKSGEQGKHASQRFTRYTQRLEVHQHRVKVFHSFRHAFKTKLEGYIAKSDVDLVLGHARPDSTGGTYTHPLKLPMHRHYEGIKQMRFKVDIPALRSLLLAGIE